MLQNLYRNNKWALTGRIYGLLQLSKSDWISFTRNFTLTILFVALATGLRHALEPTLGSRYTYIFFYSSVIFSALIGGLPYGVLATGLSSLAVAYFFLKPQGLLSMPNPDALALAIFCLNGVVVTVIAHRVRRTTEQARAESEERLRLAQQITDIGTFGWDVQTGTVRWTPTLEAMYGLPVGGFEGTREAWEGLVHPEDLPGLILLIRRSFKTFLPEQGEWRVIWPDGSIHWLAGRWQVFKDGLGKPVRMTGVNIDITERRRIEEDLFRSHEQLELRVRERTEELQKANDQLRQEIERRKETEEALKQAERNYRQIFENALEGVFQSTVDGHLLNVNRAFAKVFGYESPEEIMAAIGDIGRQLYVSPEDRLRWIDFVEKRGYIENYERQFYRKDGSKVWMSFNIHAVRNAQGATLYYEGTARDITGRKKAEEERNRLIAAIDKAGEGIYMVDSSGAIDYANAAYCAMVGYTREELIGKTIFITHGEQVEQPVLNELRSVIKTGKAWTGTLTKKRKDGTYFEEKVTITPLRNDRGIITHLVCVASDVTGYAAIQERMHQARKMEALGKLAGGIAHDFNNMLAVILGNAELALDETEDESARKNLNQIVRASLRSRDLVRQVLSFSRKSGEEKKAIKIRQIVQETSDMLRASLPATIKLHLNLQVQPDLTVFANPSQIQQVLVNLANNAAHAMQGSGGELYISLYSDVEQVTDGKPGRCVNITVKDTGPGISPEVQKRMFEPFFTTKEPGEGTGMGLAVVFGIVQDHDGSIEVESQPGHGAKFSVLLPQVEHSSMEEVVAESPLRRGKEHILLVDDEPPVVEMIGAVLKNLGYRVTPVTSGVGALEIFRASPDGFDLIFTDQTMPEITGAEFARKALGIRKDIPIILCTGYSEVVSPVQAREIGIRELLMKPLTKKEIADAMRRVLEQGEG